MLSIDFERKDRLEACVELYLMIPGSKMVVMIPSVPAYCTPA